MLFVDHIESNSLDRSSSLRLVPHSKVSRKHVEKKKETPHQNERLRSSDESRGSWEEGTEGCNLKASL
jgi:hypothetical protein